MKRKDYDDDLLVELIARGEMSYPEIGQHVGLDISTVRRIADGQSRPDLHEKIYTAMRTCLADRRRALRCGGRFGKLKASKSGGVPIHIAAVRPAARKKDYDDDLLVELIARGEMTYGEIAGRIGLQRSTVGMIARGESRPDLQEEINTAMRSHLANKRRGPNRSADETGTAVPVPVGYRNKHYDDELLVELLARGNLSHRRIAERIGLSAKMVGRIASGQSRRDLQPRIAAIAGGIQEESHRLGARWLRGLLIRHIRDGMEGTGEFARRCRMDLIDKLFDPEILKRIAAPPPPEPEPVRGLSDLSPQLQKQVLEELDGPCDEWLFIDQSGAEGEN